MSNINDLVLESMSGKDDEGISANTETPEGLERLRNMHIRPIPVWEYTPQKPGNLFDANGIRI